MLTALKNNQTIDIFHHTISDLKKWSNEKILFCPDCKDLLVFRECETKMHHFAHVSRDCSFPFREPESIEHETGKITLFHWLVEQFGEPNCKMEQHIPETNQRSDTFLLPKRFAVEFQCSPIVSSTWHRRHELYQQAHVKDLWILGYSMHKYQNKNNPFIHKLNQLEKTLLQEYNRLYYYDVLSESFIILIPSYFQQNTLYGQEFFFKPQECLLNTSNHSLDLKYEYFIKMQEKRKSNTHRLQESAKETDKYLQDAKSDSEGKQILASKKQIKYIKHLLSQKNMTIPYKLHGLLKHEARSVIKELLNNATHKT